MSIDAEQIVTAAGQRLAAELADRIVLRLALLAEDGAA